MEKEIQEQESNLLMIEDLYYYILQSSKEQVRQDRILHTVLHDLIIMINNDEFSVPRSDGFKEIYFKRVER